MVGMDYAFLKDDQQDIYVVLPINTLILNLIYFLFLDINKLFFDNVTAYHDCCFLPSFFSAYVTFFLKFNAK